MTGTPNRVIGLTFERYSALTERLPAPDRMAGLDVESFLLDECWANLAWQQRERVEWERQGHPVHLDEDLGDGEPRKHRTPHHGTATSTSTAAGRVQLSHSDPLRSIPAELYLPALTGEVVSTGGRTRCPLPSHPDEHPSAKCYGTRWICFSCGGQGDIIDLGAALYDLEPTGRGFWEIRRRLLADLGFRRTV